MRGPPSTHSHRQPASASAPSPLEPKGQVDLETEGQGDPDNFEDDLPKGEVRHYVASDTVKCAEEDDEAGVDDLRFHADAGRERSAHEGTVVSRTHRTEEC